jgi:hypothetical protein
MWMLLLLLLLEVMVHWREVVRLRRIAVELFVVLLCLLRASQGIGIWIRRWRVATMAVLRTQTRIDGGHRVVEWSESLCGASAFLDARSRRLSNTVYPVLMRGSRGDWTEGVQWTASPARRCTRRRDGGRVAERWRRGCGCRSPARGVRECRLLLW